MTTSTAIPTTTDLSSAPGASLLPWIGRGLEALWLLAVFLVPLMFLGRDYVISEAEIANVEVPKVALLRTLAAVIAVLWSLEWAIKGPASGGYSPSVVIGSIVTNAHPSKLVTAFRGWLNFHPTRWFLLATVLFFGSTFLSTVLSGSFTTSLWGEIPGQDGYSAYTIASYGILFGVIATHIKSRSQISRLLGAVILMGFLVGLYAGLQHYGHDFFNSIEASGGGAARVTVFMGNAIFAGAVLSMTIPVTLIAAAINLHDEHWGDWKPLSRFGQLGRNWMATTLWAMILSVQLLGLMFTFSRGPWGGAVLALVVFLGVVALGFGWRMLVQLGLVLGLAAVLLIAFLHWQGSVSIVNVGGWLGILLALMGAAGTVAILFIIKRFGWAVILIAVVGAVVIIAGASIIGPSALSDRGAAGTVDAGAGGESTTGQITGTISSIQTEVLGGLIGGRTTHWKMSWELIKNRPWFEFDDLSLMWLRPLIGYGPDLFRYTYLLESPPEGDRILPLEPDHAHNFFIHQTVEQGFIGGLASITLFASVFGIAAHHMLWRRSTGDPIYRLLIFGLAAVIIGRFLEMMVGVARISDLTVLWVIFGLFAASIAFDKTSQDAAVLGASEPARNLNHRSRRRAARASVKPSFSTALIIRLAVVACVAGGLGVVTWQKSINYVRASVAEGRALEHFREGNFEKSIEELNRAIELAPEVPIYYSNRANIFINYRLRPEDLHEPVCGQQEEVPYLVCLGIQSLESNLESVSQQPFYYRANIAAGNAAFNLNLYESAIESYSKAANLVPNAWPIWNDLAESQLNLGDYEDALAASDASLRITGDTEISTPALFFKGLALQGLGRPDEAVNVFKHQLSLNYNTATALDILDLIREINADRGVQFDVKYLDRNIIQDSNDAVAYYLRGLAQLAMGNPGSAILDIAESSRLGLHQGEVQADEGYARLKFGDIDGAQVKLTAALETIPQNGLLNAYVGELNRLLGNVYLALDFSETAKMLDPDIGLPDLVLSKVFVSLGIEESAREVLDSSIGLGLPTAQDYVDRGELYAFFGEFDLAFSDLNEAIRINPNEANYYNARAKTFAGMSNFESALSDLDIAIKLDSSEGKYFINRGVVYELSGEIEPSFVDFEAARSQGEITPPPSSRDVSYFAVYSDVTSVEAETRRRLNLETERVLMRDVEFNSAIIDAVPTNDAGHLNQLRAISNSLMGLDMWVPAIVYLSMALDLSATDSENFRKRGDAYLAIKDIESAVNDYNEAVRLDPNNGDYLVARANGYNALEEYDLAGEDLDEAIRLDLEFSDAYALRGYLSVLTGNYSNAFSDINHALEISPVNHDAYFKRANAYIGLGQIALALEDLGQALKLAPTEFKYLYSRGLLRYELGDLDAAIEDLDEAIELKFRLCSMYGCVDPRHVLPFLSRANIYSEIGNPEQTISDANVVVQFLRRNFYRDGWENYKPERDQILLDAYTLIGDANTLLGRFVLAEKAYRLAHPSPLRYPFDPPSVVTPTPFWEGLFWLKRHFD